MKSAAIAVLAGVSSLVCAPAASAEPPAFPDCFGQSVVFYVQTYGGAQNAAEAFDLTVKEAHNIVLASCGRTEGTTP